MPTKIEWTDETWNPVTGCTPVSAGCANCYARRMANRLKGRYGYPPGPPGDDPFKVTMHPDRLEEPLHWRKPRRVFVCSMGDLFHKDVPTAFIDQVFGVILGCQICRNLRQHTFMVLTKRPEIMRNYLSGARQDLLHRWAKAADRHVVLDEGDVFPSEIVSAEQAWPLPNVWLGVSTSNQQTLEDRVRHLLLTPAATHFISLEPMLGPVDFEATSCGQILGECDECGHRGNNPECEACDGMAGLDWVICGAETGPGARPAHPEWFRSVRDQCAEAHVPFFFKRDSGGSRLLDRKMWEEWPG